MADYEDSVKDIETLDWVPRVMKQDEVTSIVVHCDTSPTTLTEVFSALSDQDIPVMVAQLGAEQVNFVIDTRHEAAAAAALTKLGKHFELNEDCSILTISSDNMREASGIMYRIVRALEDAGARVNLIGDSYNSVSCLLSADGAERAYALLQKEFRHQD